MRRGGLGTRELNLTPPRGESTATYVATMAVRNNEFIMRELEGNGLFHVSEGAMTRFIFITDDG